MEITIKLTETQVKLLENDVLDVNEWAQKAVVGKLNRCQKRFIKHWYPILLNDPEVTSLPATEEDLIKFVTSRPDYKNRAQRDAEDAALEAERIKALEAARAAKQWQYQAVKTLVLTGCS